MLTPLEQTSYQLCLPFNPVNHKVFFANNVHPSLSICLIDSKVKQLNPASSLQQLLHDPFQLEETNHEAFCP